MSTTTNDLARELEEMQDQRDAADALLAAILRTNDEAIPWAMVKRLSHGENPVLVWREHRGMTRAELTAAASLDDGDLADMETGQSEPGLRTMVPVARALRVDLEDFVPASQD